LLGDFTHIRACKPFCEKYLTLPGKAAEGVFVQEVDEEVRRVKQHDETRREYMTLAMELKRMFAEGERTGEQKKRQ